MAYDPETHHRRSMRWYGYDYSRDGAYFVTVCVEGKEFLFGNIVEGEMALNEVGRIVEATWRDLPQRFPTVTADAFVAMPNHVHGILLIQGAASSAPTVASGHVRADGAANHIPTTGWGVADGAHVVLTGGLRKEGVASGAPRLGEIVRAFKSLSARAVNRHLGRKGKPVWQRGYYDRVIRGASEHDRIREYIATNPLRWGSDRENPAGSAQRV